MENSGSDILKLLISGCNFFESMFESHGKTHWSKKKRITYKNTFRKTRLVIEELKNDITRGLTTNRALDSYERELHDLIPVLEKNFNYFYDRYKVLSKTEIAQAYSDTALYWRANESIKNQEVINRSIKSFRDKMVQVRNDFDYRTAIGEEPNLNFKDKILSESIPIHLLLRAKLTFIDENFDHYLRILKNRSPWIGASDEKLILKVGELYLEGLKPENIIQPIPYLNIGPLKIEVTKQTSNTYSLEMIKLLNRRLKLMGNHSIVIPKKIEDHRILTTLTESELIYYFKNLRNKTIATKCAFTDEQIESLLGANFHSCRREILNDKLNPNVSKAVLKKFIYDLSQRDTGSELNQYAQFLIKNFVPFENDTIANIKKNFSRLPVDYEKHLFKP